MACRLGSEQSDEGKSTLAQGLRLSPCPQRCRVAARWRPRHSSARFSLNLLFLVDPRGRGADEVTLRGAEHPCGRPSQRTPNPTGTARMGAAGLWPGQPCLLLFCKQQRRGGQFGEISAVIGVGGHKWGSGEGDVDTESLHLCGTRAGKFVGRSQQALSRMKTSPVA